MPTDGCAKDFGGCQSFRVRGNRVWGVYYIRRKGRIVYRLKRGDQEVPRLYTADELRVLTDKSKVESREEIYPAPQWKGNAEDRLGFSDTVDD